MLRWAGGGDRPRVAQSQTRYRADPDSRRRRPSHGISTSGAGHRPSSRWNRSNAPRRAKAGPSVRHNAGRQADARPSERRPRGGGRGEKIPSP